MVTNKIIYVRKITFFIEQIPAKKSTQKQNKQLNINALNYK
ncbi:hypothetical protein MASR2M36_03590 [Providencia sp.]